MSKINSNTFTTKLIELENEFNLFHWTIGDVYIWQVCRYLIFLKLNSKLSNNLSNISNTPNLKQLVQFYTRVLFNLILRNPLLYRDTNDTLVIESGRKYRVNDEYIDIYTHYFCQDLGKMKISFTRYQTTHDFEKISNKCKNDLHFDFAYVIPNIISKFIKIKITPEDSVLALEIERRLEAEFDIRIDLISLLKNEYKNYKAKYLIFNRLFKSKKFNNIYLTNSCDKSPLIKAAKDNKICVCELQHGFMSDHTVFQHYPNVKEDSLDYFPDKFYIWDNIKMITSKLPLSPKNIVPFKNAHLEYIKSKYSNIEKKENQILVISQPTISEQILEFVIKNIEEKTKYHFIFKLHPTEESYFFSEKIKKKISNYDNLSIVDTKQPLYKLIVESKYVLGVSSTAMFEAQFLGSQILLLDLPSIDLVSGILNPVKILNPKKTLRSQDID